MTNVVQVDVALGHPVAADLALPLGVLVAVLRSRVAAVLAGDAGELADLATLDRVIAAVDSRGGHVVIHGWRTVLPITAVEAVHALEPFCGEFLYTHVDKEGLMQGTDIDATEVPEEQPPAEPATPGVDPNAEPGNPF